MKKTDEKNIARLIDHTLLSPKASDDEIMALCEEAVKHGFFSVCVHPSFVRMSRQILSASKVKISAVIGFPLGANTSSVKQYEALEAVFSGADELDVVMNSGFVKSNNWEAVEKEVSDIVTITPGVIHKIIIETCYLTDDEKKKAALMIMKTGAEFIKTSTGFGAGGAEVNDIELIKSATKGKIGIKAAGGIRTLNQVREFINAGATRIGTSSGTAIMKEALQRR
jgi:deoxyribose-phosphate aldolase